MTTTSLAALRNGNGGSTPPAAQKDVIPGFSTAGAFDLLQRIANMFSNSSMVPVQFQGKQNYGNCVIAVEMAFRMGASPFQVMQHLYIVYGKPAWSAAFLIATFNACGRFTSIKYEFQGQPGDDDYGCSAWATETATGEKVQGPLVTMGMARREGWAGKNGSKWQTMPGLMLRYRAATFLIRTVAPEIAMGLKTSDELQDVENARDAVKNQPAPQPAMTEEDITDAVETAQPTKEARPAAPKRTRKKAEPQPEPVRPYEEMAADPADETLDEPARPDETMPPLPDDSLDGDAFLEAFLEYCSRRGVDGLEVLRIYDEQMDPGHESPYPGEYVLARKLVRHTEGLEWCITRSRQGGMTANQ